jgi:putative transposase
MEYTHMNKLWQESLINQPEFLQNIVQTFLQNILNAQFDSFIGAEPYQRIEGRKGLRNGTYERNLNTRVGTITIHVCRDREGNFKPELFDRYQRSEKALTISMIEMYLNGVSTRKVNNIVEELCGMSISKSQVSNLVTKIDDDLQQWRMRPLTAIYLYLLVDARYEKVRENNRVVSKAFVTIIGVTSEGKREIIGCWVVNSESFEAWDHCFTELKDRGLKGVIYVVSDENKALKAAIKKHFQDAQWQRCQVHFMRNFMSKLSKNQQPEGIKLLQDLFAAPSKKAAFERLKPIENFLHQLKKVEIFEWLEDNIEDALAVYSLPEAHQKKMRSTNILERFNSELKRRSRVVRIFPNEASCLRLLTAICIEFSEQWDDRRFLVM